MESQVVVRPTAERVARGGVIVAREERMGRPKPWHTFESVHDGLLAAGDISQKAWEGGNRFIERYHLANGSGIRAGGTAEPVSKSTGDMSNRQALAKAEIARWSRDLAPQLFDCLESVVALGKAPSTWARDKGEHPAGGKAILCAALEQFALTH